MSLSISELLPSISALSHKDKLRLVQLVFAQLEKDSTFEGSSSPKSLNTFDPEQFRGVMKESKQIVDEYLLEVRKGWN